MLNIPFSSPDLAALVSSSAPLGSARDVIGKKSSDPFAALLDIAGAPENALVRDALRKDETKDPVAVALDAPASAQSNLFAAASVDARQLELPKEKSVSVMREADAQEPRPLLTATKPAEKNAKLEEASSITVKTSVAKMVNRATEGEEADARDGLAAKISDRVDVLSGLMNILATLLAKANGAIAQISITNVNTTATASTQVQVIGGEVTGTNAAPVTLPQISAPEALLAMQTAQVPDAESALADTHTLLQQIQQLLQQANAQNTPLSEEVQQQLDQLNTALESELNVLKELFAQAPVKPTASVQTMVEEAKFPELFLPTENAKDTLKNDIALIKEALQKFTPFSRPDVPVSETVLVANIDDIIVHAKSEIRLPVPESFSTNILVAQAASKDMPVIAAPEVVNVQNNTPSTFSQTTTAIPTLIAAAVQASGVVLDINDEQQKPIQVNSTPLIAGEISLRNGTSAAPAQSFSNLLGRAQQAPVMEQVMFHVKHLVADGSSKIHIQLDPAELGKLEIKLHVDAAGKTGITVIADEKSTLDLLQRDAQGLQKALADAGLKSDSGSLNFNLRGGQQEQPEARSHAAAHYQKSQPEEEEITAGVTIVRSYAINMPDGLDIKI